ncbi:hypothetical protein BASA81_015854 [Batrachochytrium salamandrivorans]|nr:hypothetical protein BASA81_015854 [Batrachochytrium salamandrivorans]
MKVSTTDLHADLMKEPRRTNPLSFLSKRVFALAVLMLATTGVDAASNDCVCKYDPTVDYFPNKISPQYSTNFQVEYFGSYKKLTTTDARGEKITTYAYLCGTPVPQGANVTNAIEIPIKSAAIVSTSFLPYIEYLGQRQSLHFVSAKPENLKSCLRKMSDQGQVASGLLLDADSMRKANQTAYSRTGEALDVVFMDDYNLYNGVRDTMAQVLGPRTKAIYLGEQLETTPMGKLEWVEVMAALYNMEYAVLDIAIRLDARYNCVKDAVLANPPAVKKKLTPEGMRDLVAQADVWIYTDANWNRTSSYAPPFYEGSTMLEFKDLKPVANGEVYDILGSNFNDWFEDAKAQPGVVLMDLVRVLYGNKYINSTTPRTFLRNVFNETMASQAPRLASECTNVSAPLYTEWHTGFCAVTNVTVVPNPNRVLCLGGSDATVAVPSMLVVAVALVFANW